MNLTITLLTTFVVIVGLKLCDLEKGTQEAIADNAMMGCPWCPNPWLKIIYGNMQIVGVIFTLGITAYLTITEAWWYLLVYLCGLLTASGIAFMVRAILKPIVRNSDDMFASLKIRRFIGTVMIGSGMLVFIISLISLS